MLLREKFFVFCVIKDMLRGIKVCYEGVCMLTVNIST